MTVQEVIDWARTNTRLLPLVNVGGFTNQPALAIAQDVKLRIINQTFNWWWNRKSIPSFLTSDLVYDYILTVNDFGWLERGYLEQENITSNPKPRWPLEVLGEMPVPLYVNQPTQVAVETNQYGSRVVRFNFIPTTVVFRTYLDYQARVVVPTALTDTFDPIPEDMNDIIRQLFLAYAFRMRDHNLYLSELAIGDKMLQDKKGAFAVENELNIGFIPDRGILLG